ncbi:MAG TPA: FtsX-like permease family protein [Ktedonobacteraceae bacterium]
MKIALYFNHSTRALKRGGQRTILAMLCVAVGVMAVVSVQLVGSMLQNSLTSGVRDSNGGDIAVIAPGSPLKASDLAFFAQLKLQGSITNYSPVISASGILNATDSASQAFTIAAVDAHSYPLVTPPTFVQPDHGSVSGILRNDQVIVSQDFLDRYQKHLGDSLKIYIKTATSSGQTLDITIAGVIANSGAFAQSGNLMLISSDYYLTGKPASFASYTTVNVTTADQAATKAAVRTINAHFPLVATQTVDEMMQSQQSSVDLITNFLKIAGLLALLIGGVGIVNTMQVLLSRRKTEIAMLKTTGYRRGDLYALFALETGLIGLLGSLVGSAAAIGVSFVVRNLLDNLGLNASFQIDPLLILGGVGIGCVTSLIFGLLPIIQAAGIRPLQVLRQNEHKSAGGVFQTILLLVVLSLLFCGLATIILNNNLVLGLEATYGTLSFLLLLGGIFTLVILAVSKLPVPERFQIKQILLTLLCIACAVALYFAQPIFGICLLVVALLGLFIGLLPRGLKVSTRMALRNLGRQRSRTLTTMLALFIGVFGIGTVVGLGHDTQTEVESTLAANMPYNLVVTTNGQDTNTLQANLSSIPGLTGNRAVPFVATAPTSINGQPIEKILPVSAGLQSAIGTLSQVEGYDLTQSVPSLTIALGRNLTAADANTHNVLVSEILTSTGWLGLKIKPGDTITFSGQDGTAPQTVTVVGIIAKASSFGMLGRVLAPSSVVEALSLPTDRTAISYLNVNTAQYGHAVRKVSELVPNAVIQNLSDTSLAFLQRIAGIIDIMLALAALSVIAAVLIIANAVALAMLERRRELGILKSVGYTSRSILGGIAIENAVIGGIGAYVAMLLATGMVSLMGTVMFNMTLTIEPLIVVSMIVGPLLLAVITASLVAWQATRIRPLEVLRYE